MQSKISPELTSEANLLESRFGAFRIMYAEVLQKNVLLDQLAKLVLIPPLATSTDPQLKEYRNAQDQFVAAFPTDPRVAGFKDIGNSEVILAALAKHKLTANWTQFWPASKTDVEPRIQECEAFLKDFPRGPDRDVARRYHTFLKALEWRQKGDEDSDESVQRRLKSLFEAKFMREGHVLRGKDGKVYYLDQDFDFTNRMNVTLKYFVGFNGELKSTKEMSVDQLATLKTEEPPQKAVADKVVEEVGGASQEEWNNYLKTLVKDLIATKDIDNFLRYYLIVKTLTLASRGDSILAAELKTLLTELTEDAPDMSVSWMDPGSSAARDSRNSAGVLLKRVTNSAVDDAWKRASVTRDKLADELLRQTIPIGWVERAADRRWILRTNWTSERKHSLLVAVAAEDGVRTWQQVGVVQAGTTEWNLPAIGTMIEGTVVFATPVPGHAKVASRP